MNSSIIKGLKPYEFARWAALIEAIDLIADKCEDLRIDFFGEEGLTYIKPLQIQKFIDDRAEQLEKQITRAKGIESQKFIGIRV